MPEKNVPETVAAVDLGSNSFHMVVARLDDGGHVHKIDRLKETVRLAAGLDAGHCIDADARQRALDCLARFGQRLRDIPPGNVRAVGTNTLRQARNAPAFLAEASQSLGHPVEIVGGREEARLIYLGVAHSLAGGGERRLVVDIGGGSTELIVGRGFEPLETESLYMGCVGMTQNYFANGAITERAWHQALIAAQLELEPVRARFTEQCWDAAVGASGTVQAVAKVAQALEADTSEITASGLQKLRQALLEAGHVERLGRLGINGRRAPVFAGGAVVLAAIFDSLGIKRMSVSDGALREGLVYDLVGRIRHEDVRARTVDALIQRFRIDAEHATRVRETALELLAKTARAWRLNEQDAELLTWAAQLHEIGLTVAHNQYHKHGGYLLRAADLPGFSRHEQYLLAALVRAHRRKFPLGTFERLPAEQRRTPMRLAILLRLAVLLRRGRGDDAPPLQDVKAGEGRIELRFRPGWLSAHPLTELDLEREQAYLQVAGTALEYR